MNRRLFSMGAYQNALLTIYISPITSKLYNEFVSGHTWGGGARAMPGGMTKLDGGDLGEATAFGPWDPKETPEVLKLVLRHRPLDLTLAGGWWTMCWGGGPESEGIWNEEKKWFNLEILKSRYLISLSMCRSILSSPYFWEIWECLRKEAKALV